MLKTLIVIITMAPSLLFASTGAHCPVEENGTKPRLPMGYEISSVSTTKDKDVYTIAPSQDNPYGGAKQVWTAYKNPQGKIIRLESGGDFPSQKLIQYELKKNGMLLNARIDAPKGNKKFSLPGVEDIKMAIAEPSDLLIQFGSSIEMKYSNSDCRVTDVAERFYQPNEKKAVSNKVFSVDKCESIRKVFATYEDDLNSCSDTKRAHQFKISKILNGGAGGGGGYTSGAGGGGGSPIRDVANASSNSVNAERVQAPIQLSDYLYASANGISNSFDELNYCDYFAPVTNSSSTESRKPGSSTKQ